jgi:hypothetical protein
MAYNSVALCYYAERIQCRQAVGAGPSLPKGMLFLQ